MAHAGEAPGSKVSVPGERREKRAPRAQHLVTVEHEQAQKGKGAVGSAANLAGKSGFGLVRWVHGCLLAR